jgi:hemoglobin
MPISSQNTPYELLGGDAGIRRLAETFYDVMDELPEAAAIRKMHAESLVDVKQKLYEYLSGWMGGPHHYHKKYGTVCLTKPHRPYAIGPAERDQWLMCMDETLRRIEASEAVKAMLKGPMFNIADTIRNSDGDNCPGTSDSANENGDREANCEH